MREERQEGRLPNSPARATRGLRRPSLDARNREFDRRPSYFCHSAAWAGKGREEWPGLVPLLTEPPR